MLDGTECQVGSGNKTIATKYQLGKRGKNKSAVFLNANCMCKSLFTALC